MVASASGPAVAGETGWRLSISPYAWTPGVDAAVETRFGELNADASVGDVLSAVDVALMGVVEACADVSG
jgi:hypothetical protein